LSKLFEKKDEVREVYWKARFDFEVQKEEIMYIEWMMRQKDRVVNREQENKQIVEDRENLIKDLPHPYEKEIDTCDHLIGYITEIKRKAGLIQESEDVARDTQKGFMAEAAKQDLQKRMNEGKIEEAMTKKEREAQEMVRIGGGKKKNQRKPKANDN